VFRFHLIIASILVMVCGAAICAETSADWPTFHGANRDNKSPDTGLLKEWPAGGPKQLWKVDTIGKGFSAVTVADSTVYVTGDVGNGCSLFAFDLTGKQKWKADAGQGWDKNYNGARGSATIDGGMAYVVNGHGVLTCIDVKTGQKKWSQAAKDFGGGPGGWGYAESPLIYKTAVVFKPGGSSCIVALNKQTGALIWKSSGFNAGPEYSSCMSFTLGNQDFITAGTRGGIVCVNATTGAKAWINDFSANNTANCPTPAFGDGYLFWSNGYGKGCICLKPGPTGATVAWQGQQMVCHHGGYVIQEGYIYGDSGKCVCLDLKTGDVKWSEGVVGKGSLTYADGMLYLFGEKNGQVALLPCTPEKPQVKGQFSVAGAGPSWAHPVVIGGRLYLRYDTNLYCFDVKAK
jgi:outer membrane protein assembly factor BamB